MKKIRFSGFPPRLREESALRTLLSTLGKITSLHISDNNDSGTCKFSDSEEAATVYKALKGLKIGESIIQVELIEGGGGGGDSKKKKKIESEITEQDNKKKLSSEVDKKKKKKKKLDDEDDDNSKKQFKIIKDSIKLESDLLNKSSVSSKVLDKKRQLQEELIVSSSSSSSPKIEKKKVKLEEVTESSSSSNKNIKNDKKEIDIFDKKEIKKEIDIEKKEQILPSTVIIDHPISKIESNEKSRISLLPENAAAKSKFEQQQQEKVISYFFGSSTTTTPSSPTTTTTTTKPIETVIIKEEKIPEKSKEEEKLIIPPPQAKISKTVLLEEEKPINTKVEILKLDKKSLSLERAKSDNQPSARSKARGYFATAVEETKKEDLVDVKSKETELEELKGDQQVVWEEYFDKQYKVSYFYNPETEETTWEIPPEGCTIISKIDQDDEEEEDYYEEGNDHPETTKDELEANGEKEVQVAVNEQIKGQQEDVPTRTSSQNEKEKQYGVVSLLKSNYGFIRSSSASSTSVNKDDMFFHFDEVIPGYIPKVGDEVEFEIGFNTRRQQTMAVAVNRSASSSFSRPVLMKRESSTGSQAPLPSIRREISTSSSSNRRRSRPAGEQSSFPQQLQLPVGSIRRRSRSPQYGHLRRQHSSPASLQTSSQFYRGRGGGGRTGSLPRRQEYSSSDRFSSSTRKSEPESLNGNSAHSRSRELEWVRYMDKSTNLPYWHCPATNETTWNNPSL